MVPRLREVTTPRPEGARRRDSRNLVTTLLPSPIHTYRKKGVEPPFGKTPSLIRGWKETRPRERFQPNFRVSVLRTDMSKKSKDRFWRECETRNCVTKNSAKANRAGLWASLHILFQEEQEKLEIYSHISGGQPPLWGNSYGSNSYLFPWRINRYR